MKIYIYFLLFCFLTVTRLFALNPISPDVQFPKRVSRAVKTEKLDSLVRPTSKELFLYDDNGNCISTQIYGLTENLWTPSLKYEYLYDSENSTTSKVRFDASDDGTWTYTSKTEYQYDEEGRYSAVCGYRYENSQWIETGKSGYLYDEHGNKIEYCNFDKIGDNWVKTWKRVFQFNENNQKLSHFEYELINEVWEPVRSQKIGYDSNGSQTSYSYYDYVEGEWLPNTWYDVEYDLHGNLLTHIDPEFEKWEFKYDDRGNKIEQLTYRWRESAWVLHSKIYRTYDELRNEISEIYSKFENGIWTGQRKYLYTYDTSINAANIAMSGVDDVDMLVSKPLAEERFPWDDATNNWSAYPDFSTYYYYSDMATAITEKSTPVFNGLTYRRSAQTLTLSNSTNQILSVAIFSVNGRKLGEYDLAGTLSISLSDFALGNYLVQVKNGSSVVKTIKLSNR